MSTDPNRRVKIASKEPLPHEEAAIAAVMRHHLSSSVDTLRIIPTYTDTIVYAAGVPSGTVLFKATDPHGQEPSRVVLEAWACEQAISAGVPAPHILAVDTTATLFPAPFLLMARIPGRPLQSLGLDVAQQRAYLHKTGQLLRQLHQVRVEGYGSLDDEVYLRSGRVRGQADSWRAAVVEEVEAGVLYLEHHQLLDGRTRSMIWSLLHEYESLLTAWADSVLLHGDVGANHIYVDPTGGCVTGLIDFGSRAARDPVWDLTTYAWDGGPAQAYLIEGYAPDAAMAVTIATKLAFYGICQAVPWTRWCHQRGYMHATAVLAHVVESAEARLRQGPA